MKACFAMLNAASGKKVRVEKGELEEGMRIERRGRRGEQME